MLAITIKSVHTRRGHQNNVKYIIITYRIEYEVSPIVRILYSSKST